MQTILSFLIFFCLMAVSTSAPSAHEGHGKKNSFTKHFQETLFEIAEKQKISIELLLNDKEYKIGKDVFGIVIHDNHDEDVEGAKVEVTLILPEVTKQIQPVTDKGGGLYTFPSLDLPKTGAWKLQFIVRKKQIDDSALFLFPDVTEALMPAGKYSPATLRRK